jgi:hypothetical protein
MDSLGVRNVDICSGSLAAMNSGGGRNDWRWFGEVECLRRRTS